jgi:hypothetical protein
VAPDPSCFEETAANVPARVHAATGWDADELGSVTTPTLLIVGTADFVPLWDAMEMRELMSGSQPAALPPPTSG